MANTTRNVKRQTPKAPATGTEWQNPLDNPDAANSQIAALLEEANKTPLPEIDFPESDVITLPGGLVRRDEVLKAVQVRELTGEDEEALAKASQSMNPFTFLDRMLKCGVVKVGEEPASETEKLLPQMLIGDREAIILGIRKATYGDTIKVDDWLCGACGHKTNLEMDIEDIPVTKMTDPLNDQSFKVNLRKGGFALVRLATGADQTAIFDKDGLSQAQRETVLLSRCVVSITDAAGVEHSMKAFPSMALSMSVPDRHAILNELRDRQPGPKYDKIKYSCEICNSEQYVAVTIGHLFLDFGWV